MTYRTLDIKMVVNACRNKKLEFEGEIVEIKTFEKKSKQARNKVSPVQFYCAANAFRRKVRIYWVLGFIGFFIDPSS